MPELAGVDARATAREMIFMTEIPFLNDRVGLGFLIGLGFIMSTVEMPAAAPQFTDVTLPAGITHRHGFPMDGAETDMIVAGAVAEDFDGDGWIDLYTLQAGGGTNRLYMNTGQGTFQDEATQRGAAWAGNFSGAAAADYDNDGDIDLCLTRLHANPVLLINQGDGTFQSDTHMLPVPSGNVMSPSWGDADNDGFLELAVGQWALDGQNLFLYRNQGDGTLAPYEFRMEPSEDHFVFSPRFADLNNDRRADLAVACDFGFSQLFFNRGAGMFERATLAGGVGTDENGMGSAIGDYDSDGDLDWFVSSIYDATQDPDRNWGVTGNRLYRNRGDETFGDATDETGVRDGNWGWGSAFGDLDNDGDLDLFHVNGWPEAAEPTIPLKFNQQPARLFSNDGSGQFVERAAEAGAANAGQGRGALLFDYDNDGDLDIFIANNQELQIDGAQPFRFAGPPALLRNDAPPAHHWLKVTLEGMPPLHRHGIGSRVYVSFGKRREMRELNASTGFLAHGPDRIAHFGLGTNQIAAEVRAEWVSGDAVAHQNVAVDRNFSLPAPSLQLPRRTYAVGETFVLHGASAAPPGGRVDWTLDDVAANDPLQIALDTPGMKELQLNVYAPDTDEPWQREFYRIHVRPFSITHAASLPDGRFRMSWEAFAGISYRVQHCNDLESKVWIDVGDVVSAVEDGQLSAALDGGSGRGFYRVRLVTSGSP